MRNLNVLSDNTTIKLNKRLVHKLVSLLKDELNFGIDGLLIVFVDSKIIHEINKKYLKHDYSTDIITFNYSKESNMFDGEIYISVDDAGNNAANYGVTLNNEIIRLIIHGILHLLGYNDIDKKEKKIMKKLENSLVDKFAKFDKKKIISL